MLAHIAKQIEKTILEGKNILLIPHQNPDGDAFGASTAFSEWLTVLGKQHKLFCVTERSSRFQYLPHMDEFHESEVLWREETFDVIVVFDSGDLRYAGVDKYIAGLEHSYTLINIDHHSTNEIYADLNLVVTESSSTCELLYRFFRHIDAQINQTMATSLLTGIITDTDNFTNSATTPHALKAAADLLAIGGAFNQIKDQVYRQTPVHNFGLWATIFARLQKHEELDIVYTYLKQTDFTDQGLDETATEGMINFFNSIEEGKARLILRENADGTVRGSFRTTRGDVDVSAIAKALGGGGHKKASGFTIAGPIEAALETVFTAIRALEPPVLQTQEA